jgi:hypothetical protein
MNKRYKVCDGGGGGGESECILCKCKCSKPVGEWHTIVMGMHVGWRSRRNGVCGMGGQQDRDRREMRGREGGEGRERTSLVIPVSTPNSYCHTKHTVWLTCSGRTKVPCIGLDEKYRVLPTNPPCCIGGGVKAMCKREGGRLGDER